MVRRRLRFRTAVVSLLLFTFAAVGLAIHFWSPRLVPAQLALISFAFLLLAFAGFLIRALFELRSWRRAETIYRQAFEDASDAMAIASAGAETRILEVNSKACELVGYSREELLQMRVRDLVAQDDDPAAALKFGELLLRGETIVRERQLRRKDGSSITVEMSLRAFPGGGLVVIGRDVTRRREAEEALKQSEALTRSVVYTAVDGIITANERGVIESFNPAAEQLFGYSADQVIGQNLCLLMPPADSERHDDYIRHYLETGARRIIGIGREVLARRKDGTEFPVELAISEVILPGRRLFTGIIHDLTQRKAAEAAIRATNEKLKAIIDTSPLGVITLDLEGRVLSWNDAAQRIFGWTAEETLNRPRYTAPEPELQRILELAARGESLSAVELKRPRKDGTPVEVNVWTAPLRDHEQKPIAALVLIADVTQRKLLEEQFLHAQKLEAVGRLAGGIAHDFNNILTVISGYGQMALERAAPGDELQSELDEILKATEHASALTSQLLVFSRRHTSHQETLDLGAVLARMEKMLGRIIGEDIELETKAQPDLGFVCADGSQIEQVIMNLAVNARDAMPGGGRLTIELANVELDPWYVQTHMGVKAGEYVLLAVSDTGKGIPPEFREHLFEPFFTTKERGKGTGLGLSTVYGIVKQSAGDIWVYSEVGKGTTFKVYLPRVSRSGGQAAAKPEAPIQLRGQETVLLAEDEPGVRALVREILSQYGYNVLEAADPEDALRLCREHTGEIHLLLTDVVMPVMSGRELAERASGIRTDLQVLYMSGYTDAIVLYHGVTGHDAQFIQKPFTPKNLVRKIRDILDGRT